MARPLVSVSSVRVSLTVTTKQRTDEGRALLVFGVGPHGPRLYCAVLQLGFRPASEAPLAQLDRASGYEPGGRRFESCRAHQRFQVHSGRIGVSSFRADG